MTNTATADQLADYFARLDAHTAPIKAEIDSLRDKCRRMENGGALMPSKYTAWLNRIAELQADLPTDY